MMDVQNLIAHEAADIFPLMDDARYAELAEDIRANGLRHDIILCDEKILDGRNRYRACKDVGVDPQFKQFSGDPFSYVWSTNGTRRDLTAEQRYLIWDRVAEKSATWQQQQAEIQDQANRARSEATKAQPRTKDGTKLAAGVSTSSGQTRGPGTAAKAKASGTNRGAVERMDALKKNRPDLAEKVVTGELTSAAAIRDMKRAEAKAKLEDIDAKAAKAIEGVYDVIVVDPPWDMKKIERDTAPNQVEFDYPTMSEQELASLDIPTADDCHLWLWTTHKFLPMAFRLLTSWGHKYVCTFVWHKPGGFQPFGLPQYNCEFALYARKGAPQFLDTKDFPVCFSAPRGQHSEKPEDFYDVIRRVTAGRRLDMFNRRPIEGFDGWGNEVD
jgi:N6-adenosine-specific RNA methylase IME4